jgi:hypothetical protein
LVSSTVEDGRPRLQQRRMIFHKQYVEWHVGPRSTVQVL